MYLLGFSTELHMSLAFTLLSLQWSLQAKPSVSTIWSLQMNCVALNAMSRPWEAPPQRVWELDSPAAVHAGRAGMVSFRMNYNQWEARWKWHTHFLSTPPFQILSTTPLFLCSHLPIVKWPAFFFHGAVASPGVHHLEMASLPPTLNFPFSSFLLPRQALRALKFHLQLCLLKTLRNAGWRGWLPFKAKLDGGAGWGGGEGCGEEIWAQTGWEAYAPSTPIAFLAFIFKSM